MTEHDNPYDWLADVHADDHRWAYGTGFTDPLAGIDTSVPEGMDAKALATYCLALGDDGEVKVRDLAAWALAAARTHSPSSCAWRRISRRSALHGPCPLTTRSNSAQST